MDGRNFIHEIRLRQWNFLIPSCTCRTINYSYYYHCHHQEVQPDMNEKNVAMVGEEPRLCSFWEAGRRGAFLSSLPRFPATTCRTAPPQEGRGWRWGWVGWHFEKWRLCLDYSFKFISNGLSIPPHTVSGTKETESDADDGEDDGEDLANAAKDDDLQKQHKKAGLPELVLDSLPSASANRMMILFFRTKYTIKFVHWT